MHFMETEAITPSRTKSLGTAEGCNSFAREEKTLRFGKGLNLHEIFRAFLSCANPHIPTEGLSKTDALLLISSHL